MKTGGTGGANTNLNGLTFEKDTDLAAQIEQDLSSKYTLKPHPFLKESLVNSKLSAYNVIRLKDKKLIGVITKKRQFYNIMHDHYHLENINHKRWEPDEAFFNFERNTIFIVEKKWQQNPGSTDEKILGFINKRRLYQANFNKIKIDPKPTVEFSALFNSSWWLYGLKIPPERLITQNNYSEANDNKYQDYFDALRMDGIKIFFDTYEYWWFGL